MHTHPGRLDDTARDYLAGYGAYFVDLGAPLADALLASVHLRVDRDGALDRMLAIYEDLQIRITGGFND